MRSPKKRSLLDVNEHFEGERNAEITLLDTFFFRNAEITVYSCFTNNTTAWVETPSSRPSKPIRSVVVAFTNTRST